jgi:stalled ribosome alternative rescue factor ArfA
MKTRSEKPKLRALVPWNTGQRIHPPKKGKGAYNRKNTKKGVDK